MCQLHRQWSTLCMSTCMCVLMHIVLYSIIQPSEILLRLYTNIVHTYVYMYNHYDSYIHTNSKVYIYIQYILYHIIMICYIWYSVYLWKHIVISLRHFQAVFVQPSAHVQSVVVTALHLHGTGYADTFIALDRNSGHVGRVGFQASVVMTHGFRRGI